MFSFILKRILHGFGVVLGVIVIIFFIFHALPADPARMLLGQRSDVETIENIRKEFGLDYPLHIQFLRYLNDISFISFFKNDKNSHFYLDTTIYKSYLPVLKINKTLVLIKPPYLRYSYQNRQPVLSILQQVLPATFVLAFATIFFSILLGILLGMLSASFFNTVIDRVILMFSVLGMSFPSFFVAILFAWLFAYVLADLTGLNLYGSLYSVDPMGEGEYIDLKNLVLPTLTLSIRPLAVITSLTRNSFLTQLQSDYVRTAFAKGATKTRIYFKHVLRNALNPVVTSASNWLASLLAGAIFVEYIFGWKGLGYVTVNALEQYDFPVIMGSVICISLIFVCINIIVDITYSILDPKIRFINNN